MATAGKLSRAPYLNSLTLCRSRLDFTYCLGHYTGVQDLKGKGLKMKKLSVTIFAFALLAAASGARADVPSAQTAICQSGPVLAACPPGVQSNSSVSASTFGNTNSSVAYGQNSGGSVATPTNNNQSVAAPLSNSGSVAWGQNSSNQNRSVAYSATSTSTTNSVASGGWSGGNSGSVVH